MQTNLESAVSEIWREGRGWGRGELLEGVFIEGVVFEDSKVANFLSLVSLQWVKIFWLNV